jgi:predicted Zn-dependent protease
MKFRSSFVLVVVLPLIFLDGFAQIESPATPGTPTQRPMAREYLSNRPMTRQDVIMRVCHASEVDEGPEFDKLSHIQQMLGVGNDQKASHHIHLVLVDSDSINAWESNLTPADSLVCIPTGIVEFMGKSEGELAFVIAHEIGHALDDTCKTAVGRAYVESKTKSGSIMGRLFGATDGNEPVNARVCEQRADQIGFEMLIRASYNPYDAAAAFGRLQMYLRDTSNSVFAKLAEMQKDHPITPDRLRHIQKLIAGEAGDVHNASSPMPPILRHKNQDSQQP